MNEPRSRPESNPAAVTGRPHVAWVAPDGRQISDSRTGRSFWRSAALAIAALGVLFALAVVFKVNLTVSVLRDYDVGQCSNRNVSDPQGPLELVPCNEPHLYEVIGTFRIPSDAPPTFDLDTIGLDVCLAAFRDQTGRDFRSQNALTIRYLAPPPSTWRTGEATAACAVHRPDERPLFESIRIGRVG